ncbi:Acyl-CoA ligase azaF [Fusarium oxysporum f. sp. albedinis]|nr:Acyl-CoA ligase azaF [Fusarium oxysporum f. sp. albedinis]
MSFVFSKIHASWTGKPLPISFKQVVPEPDFLPSHSSLLFSFTSSSPHLFGFTTFPWQSLLAAFAWVSPCHFPSASLFRLRASSSPFQAFSILAHLETHPPSLANIRLLKR